MGAPTLDPHQVPEAEADRRIDAIVRGAIAELRAIDPGCDCTLLRGARAMLAFALDERVIPERDAFAALDLVRCLEIVQSERRDRLGLDHRTVDGPLDPRAAADRVVVDVAVRLGNRWMTVSAALDALDTAAEAGGEWPRQGITGPGAWSTRDGATWTRHEESVVAMAPGMIAGYLIGSPAQAYRAMFDTMPAGDRRG